MTVGLPNVGKSSLTNLLAGASHAEAANYPFCTIDPNVVQCIVPDKNFKYLADTYNPPSVVPAALKVTDIAGLIKGASEGAGLGNAFLSHIAAVDGIFHLIRDFDSDEVIHVDDSVDPIRDLETIQGELCAKDRETLKSVEEKERERVRKEKGLSRSADIPLSDTFVEAYGKCTKLIESNTPVQTGEFRDGEVELIKDWGLITTKPQIYVVNLSKRSFIRKGSKWLPKIGEWVKEHGGGQVIPVSVEFEEELFHMKDDPEAQKGRFCSMFSFFQKSYFGGALPLLMSAVMEFQFVWLLFILHMQNDNLPSLCFRVLIPFFSYLAMPFHDFSHIGSVHRGSDRGWSQGPRGASAIDGSPSHPIRTSRSVSAVLLHGRSQGSPSLDHHERLSCSTSSWNHSHGF